MRCRKDIAETRGLNRRGSEIFGRSQTDSVEFENIRKRRAGFGDQIELNSSTSEVFRKTSVMEENRDHAPLCIDRIISNDVYKVFLQRLISVEGGEIAHSILKKFDRKIDTKRISVDETNRRSTSKINPKNYLESKGFNVKLNGYSESAFREFTGEDEEVQMDLKIKTPSERIEELLGQDSKSKKQKISVSHGRSM